MTTKYTSVFLALSRLMLAQGYCLINAIVNHKTHTCVRVRIV